MREREPDVEALRTRLARKFTTLADEVTECFEDFHIGSGDYVVELPAPEGVSTSGGRHALQHLRLRPRRPGYAVVVAGSVNALEKWAELRTFEHVSLVHELRGRPLEITEAEWEELLRKSEVVLHLANIDTARVGPPPDLLKESQSRGERGRGRLRLSTRAVVIFCSILLLALVVIARVAQILLRG